MHHPKYVNDISFVDQPRSIENRPSPENANLKRHCVKYGMEWSGVDWNGMETIFI